MSSLGTQQRRWTVTEWRIIYGVLAKKPPWGARRLADIHHKKFPSRTRLAVEKKFEEALR